VFQAAVPQPIQALSSARSGTTVEERSQESPL
jgi:hypothetical protein